MGSTKPRRAQMILQALTLEQANEACRAALIRMGYKPDEWTPQNGMAPENYGIMLRFDIRKLFLHEKTVAVCAELMNGRCGKAQGAIDGLADLERLDRWINQTMTVPAACDSLAQFPYPELANVRRPWLDVQNGDGVSGGRLLNVTSMQARFIGTLANACRLPGGTVEAPNWDEDKWMNGLWPLVGQAVIDGLVEAGQYRHILINVVNKHGAVSKGFEVGRAGAV